MIRVAKFNDIPALSELLRETYRRSKYNGRTGINEKAMEQMLMGLIAGHGQNGPCGSHFMVAEQGGKVVGFMAGTLNRVYNFLDGLVATDVFLINNEGTASDTFKLVDDYLAWAKANPKVIEIGLSWSDAIPGGDKIAKLYKHLGAKLVGEQYEIRLDMEQPGNWEKVAA